MTMYATAMDFYHIRSRRALNRVVRRIARHLRKVILQTMGEEKELGNQVLSGEIKGTEEFFIKLLNNYKEEEEEMDKMIRIQEIELREEEKTWAADKDLLSKAFSELEKSFPEQARKVQEGFAKDLAEASKYIGTLAARIRVEEKDMYLDRERILKYAKVAKDSWLAMSIRRLARNEYKEISLEEEEEHELERLVSDIIRAIHDGNQKKVEDYVNQLNKLGTEVRRQFEMETKDLFNIVHDVNVIHIHLLHKILGVTPKLLGDIASKGFPADKLQNLTAQEKSLVTLAANNLKKLYFMARYVEKRA